MSIQLKITVVLLSLLLLNSLITDSLKIQYEKTPDFHY